MDINSIHTRKSIYFHYSVHYLAEAGWLLPSVEGSRLWDHTSCAFVLFVAKCMYSTSPVKLSCKFEMNNQGNERSEILLVYIKKRMK